MDSTQDATPDVTPSASTQTPTGSVQGTKGNNSDDVTDANIVGRKQRKLKSEVWKHFNREEKPNKIVDATCKYCNKRFDGTSRGGTSHLNNHLKSCIHRKRQYNDISQSVLGKIVGGNDPQPKSGIHKFDPTVERALFAKMIAKHDLPFTLCQFEYFRHWVSYIMPTYNFRTRNTVKTDLMDVYKMEKSRIYAEIQSLSSKVTLTTDGWKPKHQNRGYFCVTCHFIDDKWMLHKRIIAFHVVEYPHHGVRLSEWLRNRILEWNIVNNMFSIVVDNASNNMGMLDGIKTWLIGKKALRHGGDMFHVRCSAHIVNLIVKSGLDGLQGLIEKIRKSVLYVNSSPKRGEVFEKALMHNKINKNRRVSLDVETRWNSTFEMLSDALKLRVAFARLADLDPDYKLLPTEEEWEKGNKICECLKIFYDVTKQISGTKYPTYNCLFLHIWKIRMALDEWMLSEHKYIEKMGSDMKEKFDKYWEECGMGLTVAIILDPRYKMKIVECVYTQMHGKIASIYVDKVRDFLVDLYFEYSESSSSSNIRDVGESIDSNISKSSSQSSKDVVNELFKKFVAKTGSSSTSRKNDLEQYLDEGLEVMDDSSIVPFDILAWWGRNGPKFPTLARMARDILAIPASSVASESAFSLARRVITDTRSSLNSETVEALICTKDWLPLLGDDLGNI